MKNFLLATILLAGVSGACAQPAYPSKPVRIIVPFTAGSGTDIVGRTIGEAIGKSMGQPVIIENKPGAGGSLGAAQVARAEADGYTLLVHSAGHAVNQAIYPNLPYDTLRDFAGVTPLASLPNVLVVPPGRGWNNVHDLVAAAKARPGALNFASAGVGSATHVNLEKFRVQAGIDVVHVPFRGTPEALSEVMGGRIDAFFAPLVAALTLIKEGKVQALAVSTPTRAAVLPDLPTTVEAGIPGSEYVFWVGMLAPAKTPREILLRLNSEVVKALNAPDVKARLASLGAEPMPMTPVAFDAFVRTEVEQAMRLAKAANLTPQ